MIIIGDIHGELELLKGLYENIKKYNEPVYSVGDIVDRGYSPVECIKFVRENNISAVKGNHEEMMITSFEQLYGKRRKALWMKNGGWVTFSLLEELPKDEKAEILEWANNLPLYIYSKDEDVLIMHAGMHYNNLLSFKENLENIKFDEDFLWYRRDYIESTNFETLKTIFVTGHTPFKKIMFDDFNRYFIDTGAFHTGTLSAIRITEDIIEGFSYNKKRGFKIEFSKKR